MSKFFLWFLGFIVLLLFTQAAGLWQKSFFPVWGMFFVFSFLVIFFEKPSLSLPLSFLVGIFLDVSSGFAFLSFTLTLSLICLSVNFAKKFFENLSLIFFIAAFFFSFLFFYFFPRLLDLLSQIFI